MLPLYDCPGSAAGLGSSGGGGEACGRRLGHSAALGDWATARPAPAPTNAPYTDPYAHMLGDTDGGVEAEREAHAATLLPFRSWCSECVMGRSDNPPHRRVTAAEEGDRRLPEVHLDYCILGSEGQGARVVLVNTTCNFLSILREFLFLMHREFDNKNKQHPNANPFALFLQKAHLFGHF